LCAGRARHSRLQEDSISVEPRINDRIRVAEVRLVGPNGEQVGIVPIARALDMALQADLDLVEVAPTARPPVVKIMDYGKFKYENAQKAREARRNQVLTVIKEMKLRPKIDGHDYETKKGHVVRFLKAGDKVKVTIMFRGREQSRPEIGFRLLQKLAADVTELGFVESAPKLDGRNMIMVLAPHKGALKPVRPSGSSRSKQAQDDDAYDERNDSAGTDDLSAEASDSADTNEELTAPVSASATTATSEEPRTEAADEVQTSAATATQPATSAQPAASESASSDVPTEPATPVPGFVKAAPAPEKAPAVPAPEAAASSPSRSSSGRSTTPRPASSGAGSTSRASSGSTSPRPRTPIPGAPAPVSGAPAGAAGKPGPGSPMPRPRPGAPGPRPAQENGSN
jgi:translation initiation factor IF-3